MKLEARDISFCYPCGTSEVLAGTAITVESHERVGLAAPSGFGKTTLCKILAGYEQPARGTVLLDGQPLPRKGYCPVQLIWQNPELAVNPRLRLKTILAEGDEVEPRIFNELGIESQWMNRFPGELSGGELQRFCIARALGRGTKFLLADEISAMLDLITQSQLWYFIRKETQQRGIGLLVVSHSPQLLNQVCTRQVEWNR